MKKLKTLLGVALTGVLFNAGLAASAQPAESGCATVIRVRGIASYSLGDDQWHPLVAGKILPPGASIRTGESAVVDAVVDIVLGKAVDLPQAGWIPSRVSPAPDAAVRGFITYQPAAEQNVVRMMAGSLLVIDKLTTTSTGADTVSDTELDLKKGGIYASVKKLSPAAQYVVKTPTGIAGVRGTQFSIILNPDGTIKSLAVYKTQGDEGLVLAVTDANGVTQTYIISDGQVWESGSSSPVPITPELKMILQAAFAALRTAYFQAVSYNYDYTFGLESSDYGKASFPGVIR